MGVAGGGGVGRGQGDGGAAAATGLVCGGAGDDARLMFFGEDGELLGEEEEEEEAELRLQACSRADDTGTPSFLKCVRADVLKKNIAFFLKKNQALFPHTTIFVSAF